MELASAETSITMTTNFVCLFRIPFSQPQLLASAILCYPLLSELAFASFSIIKKRFNNLHVSCAILCYLGYHLSSSIIPVFYFFDCFYFTSFISCFFGFFLILSLICIRDFRYFIGPYSAGPKWR